MEIIRKLFEIEIDQYKLSDVKNTDFKKSTKSNKASTFIHAMSKPEGYLRKNRNNVWNSLRCEVEI